MKTPGKHWLAFPNNHAVHVTKQPDPTQYICYPIFLFGNVSSTHSCLMKIDFSSSLMRKIIYFGSFHAWLSVLRNNFRPTQCLGCLCASVKFKVKHKLWQNFPFVAFTFINSVHAWKNFYHNHLDGDFLFHGILVRGHRLVSFACLLQNYLDGGNLIHFLANEFQSDCSQERESFQRSFLAFSCHSCRQQPVYIGKICTCTRSTSCQ